MRDIEKSHIYVSTSIAGKTLAAFAQLFAIYVFIRAHTQSESAIIFLLIGYGIWFQVFEMGLSQSLQNSFNQRKCNLSDIRLVILAHFLLMTLFFFLINFIPLLPSYLLPTSQYTIDSDEFKVFSLGMSMMIVASSNTIVQRALLILNKGILGNAILIVQSTIIIFGLWAYYLNSYDNLFISVLIYFTPPILINFFMVYKISIRRLKKIDFSLQRLTIILKNALYFLILNILSSFFLGSDYYFVAHFLDSGEITQYHLVTRLYFFSYIAYFSYIQYKTKKLNPKIFKENTKLLRKNIYDSIIFGIFCVSLVSILYILIDRFFFLHKYSDIQKIDFILLFSAFSYYVFRVIRDVYLVVFINAEMRYTVMIIYTIELIFGISLLTFSVKQYGFYGIFISMALVTAFSSTILFILYKKIAWIK
jgi:hypothetical protein